MRKAVLVMAIAAAAVLGAAIMADAATTTLTASPKSSIVGQKVTFTGKFTPQCTGAVQASYFTIDGTRYLGTYSQSGQNSTGTYSTSALKVGKHTITYQWSVSSACKGSASLTFTVAAKPSPSPTPKPTPSPSPLPTPSPTPVDVVPASSTETPLTGYIGGGLILFAIVAGLVLAVTSRR